MLTLFLFLAVLWCIGWIAVLAQPAEGAMGTFPLPAVVSQMGQEFFYRVQQEQTFDFKGIQFFHLKSTDGTATISVDGDVNLAAALKALEGQRVKLTIEPATLVLKKVER